MPSNSAKRVGRPGAAGGESRGPASSVAAAVASVAKLLVVVGMDALERADWQPDLLRIADGCVVCRSALDGAITDEETAHREIRRASRAMDCFHIATGTG
jgi:hypothetical protein